MLLQDSDTQLLFSVLAGKGEEVGVSLVGLTEEQISSALHQLLDVAKKAPTAAAAAAKAWIPPHGIPLYQCSLVVQVMVLPDASSYLSCFCTQCLTSVSLAVPTVSTWLGCLQYGCVLCLVCLPPWSERRSSLVPNTGNGEYHMNDLPWPTSLFRPLK